MPIKKDDWYYEIEGERYGPFTKAIIRKKMDTGEIPTGVKVFQRRKKNKESWGREQIKLFKLSKRDVLIMFIALVIIAGVIAYLVLSMYNKNSAPPDDIAGAFNIFDIVHGLL